MIDIRPQDRNGPVVASKIVRTTDQVMIITRDGVMIRTHVDGVPEYGRNTNGVRLISLNAGDQVIGLAPVIDREDAAEDSPGEGSDVPDTDEAADVNSVGDDEGGNIS